MSPAKHAKDTATSKAAAKKKVAARTEPKVKTLLDDERDPGLLGQPRPVAPHPDRPYADD